LGKKKGGGGKNPTTAPFVGIEKQKEQTNKLRHGTRRRGEGCTRGTCVLGGPLKWQIHQRKRKTIQLRERHETFKRKRGEKKGVYLSEKEKTKMLAGQVNTSRRGEKAH